MFSPAMLANIIAQNRLNIPDLPMNTNFSMFDELLRNQQQQQQQQQQLQMMLSQIPMNQDLLFSQLKQQIVNQHIQNFFKAMTDMQQLQAKIPASPPMISQKVSPGVSPSIVTTTNNLRKRPNSSSGAKKSTSSSENEPNSDVIQPKRSKQLRKLLAEDTETNSPVSGMYIKELSEVSPDDIAKAAELDETASYVHVSDESRKKIQEIPNIIGDSVCSLCKVKFEDVFRLAMHKCPRIVHEEYKCPECDKVFSCPANLASHRRWHGPRPQKSSNQSTISSSSTVSLSPSTREPSPIDQNNQLQELLLALTKNNSIQNTADTVTSEATKLNQEINIIV